MKYDWDGRTSEKPAKNFAVLFVILAAAALAIVVAYLASGTGF